MHLTVVVAWSGLCEGGNTTRKLATRRMRALTAANGDQVTLTILDMPCPVAGEPGIYDGVSTYHITGGSGRYAGATGEGSFDGRGDFTNPSELTFTYTFDGTVSATN